MKKERIVRKIEMAEYVLFAVFYFWIAAQVPYTHDDWSWGLDIGIYQLISANINSRYAGNFFVVIMTRSEIVKTIIMGIFYFLCPFLISSLVAKLCHRENPKFRLLYFIVSNVILLSVPRLVWREACGWVSGFANFGISASFMLICFHAWLPVFDNSLEHNANIWRCVVNFIAVFLGQLFIENLAITMALTSVLIACIACVRRRKDSVNYILMAVGAILGLVVMFNSTIYATLFETGEAVGGYRKFLFHPNNSGRETVTAFLYQCAVLAIRSGEANTVLSSLVLILLGISFVSQKEEKKTIKIGVCIINTTLTLYMIGTRIANIQYSSQNISRAMIAAVLNAGYILMVILETFRMMKNNKPLATRLLAVFGFALALIAPLMVIDENGSRLFYTFIVVISVYALILADHLLLAISNKSVNVILGASSLIAALLLTSYSVVYFAIGTCKTIRATLIEEANSSNAEIVTLPSFPYDEYIHFPNPSSDHGQERFKEFFNIDEETDVKFE